MEVTAREVWIEMVFEMVVVVKLEIGKTAELTCWARKVK